MSLANRILKYSVVAWICLFSLFDAHAISGMVLCFGQDGHVAVEAMLHEEEDKAAPSDCNSSSTSFTEAKDLHCGRCFDLSLTMSCDSPAVASKCELAVPVIAAVPVPRLEIPIANPIEFLRRFPPNLPASPAISRSVVLLV